MRYYDEKKEVVRILGSLTNDSFAQLKVTDYAAEDEMRVDPDLERKDAEIDDVLGVDC